MPTEDQAIKEHIAEQKHCGENSASPLHSYLLIRKDMPLEAQMAQCAHAAQEAAFLMGGAPQEAIHIVILECPDERELLLAADRLERKGLEPSLFYEPHWPKGHSSLYLRPQRRNARLKKTMATYKLWRPSESAQK